MGAVAWAQPRRLRQIALASFLRQYCEYLEFQSVSKIKCSQSSTVYVEQQKNQEEVCVGTCAQFFIGKIFLAFSIIIKYIISEFRNQRKWKFPFLVVTVQHSVLYSLFPVSTFTNLLNSILKNKLNTMNEQ